ncbi:MAG: hypothetical protein IT185_08765 [Acidobacteria bacterium]|nr:hypothetical protein [Acidobacteriota bacterium]
MTEFQRRLVIAVFLYTCIEGLVVNLFYPNPLAYLPKDAMIAVLYLGLMSSQANAASMAQFKGPFTIFAAICILFVAMPTPVSLLGIAVALKQRLYYIPLMFVGYHYMRGEADLVRLLRAIAWSAIPVCLFGIYLFFGGPYALKEIGAEYSHVFYSTTGATSGQSFYRVPGTFNSPGQFGGYLYMVAVYMVAFLLVKGLSPKDRRMILLVLVLLLPTMLVTGSRTPLLLFLVLSGLVAVLSKQLPRFGVAGAVGYFVMIIALDYFGGGVADRMQSTFSQDNVSRFTGTFFGQLWFSQLLADPVGGGLGVATIGARHFSPPGTVRLVESYIGIIVTEMGMLGLMGFLALAVPMGAYLVRSRPWMKNSPAQPIWVAGFLQLMFILLLTMNGNTIDSIPGNLYFWFFFGVMVKMVDLERTRLMYQTVGTEPPRGSGG